MLSGKTVPGVGCKTNEEEQYFGPNNKPMSKRSGI